MCVTQSAWSISDGIIQPWFDALLGAIHHLLRWPLVRHPLIMQWCIGQAWGYYALGNATAIIT